MKGQELTTALFQTEDLQSRRYTGWRNLLFCICALLGMNGSAKLQHIDTCNLQNRS